MKKLVFVFTFLLNLTNTSLACEDRYIVTDFDDTIKTYGRDGEIFRIGNAIFGRKINSGMNYLLKEISEECDARQGLTVLTASPKIISPSIKRLLSKHNIYNYELITRPLNEETLDYKISRVNQVSLEKNKPLILVGDDTSKDPDAYYYFAQKNPQHHLATYIHNVRNRPALDGQINYITSYEVAIHEFNAKRLNERDALTVGLLILSSSEYGVIPRYGHCPKTYKLPTTSNEELSQISEQISEKVESICEKRLKK